MDIHIKWWLRPLVEAGGCALSISNDTFHYGENKQNPADAYPRFFSLQTDDLTALTHAPPIHLELTAPKPVLWLLKYSSHLKHTKAKERCIQ